ncbi:hypothetical protein FQA39_LY01962 [Lamprigera yunnana]|nr:hypothetical protein FQA39_LY01962 [Lamprigera yunnana]
MTRFCGMPDKADCKRQDLRALSEEVVKLADYRMAFDIAGFEKKSIKIKMFTNPMKLIPGTISQVIAVITCTLLSISNGMNFGWTAPIGPLLLSPNSTIKTDGTDILLLETLYTLGGLCELPISFYLLDKIGRKNTVLLAAITGLIAWIMIASTSLMTMFFVARFIAGASGNLSFMALPAYIAEISDKKIRGHLLTVIYIMVMLGALLMYAVGPYISIPASAAIGASVLITQLLTFSFMPKSPYYLLMKNQKEEARKSLIIFRSVEDVEKELEEITFTVEKEMSERKGILDLFRIKSFEKKSIKIKMFTNPMKLIPGTISQVIAVITCTLLSISNGMNFGWTAPIGPLLLSPNSTIKTDGTDILLLETLYTLGGLCELPISFYLLDKIGRKNTVLLAAITGLIAWIMIASTSLMTMFFVARFIAGASGNLSFMALPAYIAEISDKKIRGHLLTVIYIMVMLGALLMYAVGPYISIPASAAIGASVLITQLLTFSFMPKSPYYLLMKNQKEEARKSLIIFRSVEDVEKELEEITFTVEKEMSERKGILDLFRIKSNLKAAMIITVLILTQNFSGTNVMFMNMNSILIEAGGSISANTGAILYSLMLLVGVITTGILVDVTGRKVLLCFEKKSIKIKMFTNPMKLIPGTISQVIAVITCTLLSISNGMNFGWTAPIGPLLLSPNSTIKTDGTDILLLETLYTLGGLCELPISFYLLDKIGRKNTVLLAAITGLIAWIMIASTSLMTMFFVARFIAGASGNLSFMALPAYIAEISDKKIRGHLLTVIYIMVMLGALLIYAVGPYISIPASAAIGASVLITQLLTFSFMPKSPYYLLMKNQKEEARKSLIIFRSVEDVEKELEEITFTVEKEMSERKGILDLFRIKSNLKAAMIITVLILTQNFSGTNVMFMNMNSILIEAGGSISANTGAILYSLMLLVGVITTGILVDVTGRKVLLCTSTILTTIFLFVLAAYFTIKGENVNVGTLGWLPIFAVLSYAFTFQSGLGPVPNLFIAELYPTNIKAIGMVYADVINALNSILALIIFHVLQKFGMQVPFYLFGCCCALSLLFSIFVVPETKGKSLREIQYLLKGREVPNVSKIDTDEENSETQLLNETLNREHDDYGTSSN